MPGAVVVAVSQSLWPEAAESIQPSVGGDFVLGLFAFAVAYMAGLLCHVAARAFMDFASEWSFRPILLWLYDRKLGKFPKGKAAFVQINTKYREAIGSVVNGDGQSALCKEVLRRRRYGRIVRTAVVPALLFTWHQAREAHWERSSFLGCAAIVLLVSLILYSYSELMIYKEAKLRK